MSVAVVVFSKDRPMQLDALLSSMKANMKGDPLPATPHVLWTASDDAFRRGYERCFAEHPEVVPVFEHGFQSMYEKLLGDAERFIVHFVDDDVCHGRANLSHAAFELDRDDDLAAFSLRLGTNCARCYPLDADQELPSTLVDVGGMLEWRWAGGAQHDWSYWPSLDGDVLRVDDVRALLHGSVSNNPNQLEQTLASRAWMRSGMRPKMACYARSCVTGVPANVVSTTHNNRNANLYDPAWLNALYLGGSRIDWRAMNWDCVDAAHVVLPYIFTDAPIADAA